MDDESDPEADEGQDEEEENEQEDEDEDEDKVNALFDQIQNDGDDMDMFKSSTGKKVKNAIKKDPFLKYGTGIKNYFALQTQMIMLFAILSVFAIA